MEKRFFANKRGQELSIGTLILIVLGVIVLVLLILGFTMGWTNLWDKINIFGGGGSISDVVIACQLAATSDAKYNYCQKFHKVKVGGNIEYVNCLDSRVDGGLTNKLEGGCDGKTAIDLAIEYCIQNRPAEGKTIIINGEEFEKECGTAR